MDWVGQVCASEVDIRLAVKAIATTMALMFVSLGHIFWKESRWIPDPIHRITLVI
jgi:hypothetical protein